MPTHQSNIPFDKNCYVNPNKRKILKKTWHDINNKGGEPLVSKTYEDASFYSFISGLNQIQKTSNQITKT